MAKDDRPQTQDPRPLWPLIVGDGTPKQALVTALLVGTVLVAINHGDAMLRGELPSVLKIVLTYCVPYCVVTWGAVTGKRAQWRADGMGE